MDQTPRTHAIAALKNSGMRWCQSSTLGPALAATDPGKGFQKTIKTIYMLNNILFSSYLHGNSRVDMSSLPARRRADDKLLLFAVPCWGACVAFDEVSVKRST